MEAALSERLHDPWRVGYSALRRMACQNWQTKHACPVCLKPERKSDGGKDPGSYISGCLAHLHTGTGCTGSGCIGSLFNVDSPATTGATMIPTTAELLQKMFQTSALETSCLA